MEDVPNLSHINGTTVIVAYVQLTTYVTLGRKTLNTHRKAHET